MGASGFYKSDIGDFLGSNLSTEYYPTTKTKEKAPGHLVKRPRLRSLVHLEFDPPS